MSKALCYINDERENGYIQITSPTGGFVIVRTGVSAFPLTTVKLLAYICDNYTAYPGSYFNSPYHGEIELTYRQMELLIKAASLSQGEIVFADMNNYEKR